MKLECYGVLQANDHKLRMCFSLQQLKAMGLFAQTSLVVYPLFLVVVSGGSDGFGVDSRIRSIRAGRDPLAGRDAVVGSGCVFLGNGQLLVKQSNRPALPCWGWWWLSRFLG